MENLVFDEGLKEYQINGDPNRIVKFNPNDISLIERFYKAMNLITEYQEKLKDVKINPDGSPADQIEQNAKLIEDSRLFINGQIDSIFGDGTAETVFGNQSPLSFYGGKYLFERFLNTVKPVLQKEMKGSFESQQRAIDKYRKVYHK